MISINETHPLSRFKERCLTLVCIAALITCHSCGCACRTATNHQPEFSKSDFASVQKIRGKSGHSYPTIITPEKGKPVLLLHDLTGLNQGALLLAQDLRKQGYQVYAPILFGRFAQNSPLLGFLQTAISPRFTLWNRHRSGAVVQDLDRFCDFIATQHPGQPITVIGNCLTGGLPLATFHRADVKTIVLCQPALPLQPPPLKAFQGGHVSKRSWGLSDQHLVQAAHLLKTDESKRIIVLHYLLDHRAPHQKIQRLGNLIPRSAKSRFSVFSGVLKNDSQSQVIAQLNGWTPVTICDENGHSTLINTRYGEDLLFRELLYESLK